MLMLMAGAARRPAAEDNSGDSDVEWDDVDVPAGIPQVVSEDAALQGGQPSSPSRIASSSQAARGPADHVEHAVMDDIIDDVKRDESAETKAPLRGRCRRRRMALNDDSGDETGGDFGAASQQGDSAASLPTALPAASAATIGSQLGERIKRVDRPSLAARGFDARAATMARRGPGRFPSMTATSAHLPQQVHSIAFVSAQAIYFKYGTTWPR